MTRLPVVLVDMDEVLVDLLSAWCAQYHQLGGELLAPACFKHYGWEDQVGDKKLFLQVLKSGGMFYSAKPRSGALEGFKALCRDFDTFVVTKVMSNAGRTYDGKLHWMWRHFPAFDRGRIIFTGHKHLVHGDWLIDDSVANLDAWCRADPAGERTPILMDRPFNQEELSFHRVSDLMEAHAFITESIK